MTYQHAGMTSTLKCHVEDDTLFDAHSQISVLRGEESSDAKESRFEVGLKLLPRGLFVASTLLPQLTSITGTKCRKQK